MRSEETIIEPDSFASIAVLILGVLAIVTVGSLAFYFLRVYSSDAAQQTATQTDAHPLPQDMASTPTAY